MTKVMMSVFLLVLAASLLDGTDADFLFSPTTATVSVPENTTAGTAVYKFNVTGAAGTETYKVMEGATTSSIFEATAKDVKLIATASLDYEVAATHTLTIIANVGGTDLASTLKLTVTVTNVAPSFTSPTGSLNIADASQAGTPLGNFVATDPGSSPITYDMDCGNSDSDFAIDTSGAIKVAQGRTIDVDRTSCYTLVIHAADNATQPLSATATVVVTVTGGQNTVTCKANSKPCNNSEATLLAVPMFVMFLCWISSNILK